jgi:hypothetical protein
MICYTNHALDQFLSSIIKKLSLEPGQIVRVGGRSTHSDIEPFLIQKLRQQRRDVRTKNEDLSHKYELIKIIKKQMDDCKSKYYNCSQKLLDIDQLLQVMTKQQFLSFIDPVLSKLDIFNGHWNLNKGGIYCCRSVQSKQTDEDESEKETDEDESENSESESVDDEPELSFYERAERMKHRIDCHRINKLSDDDRNEINQLFVKWLDATQIDIIVNKTQDPIEGIIYTKKFV